LSDFHKIILLQTLLISAEFSIFALGENNSLFLKSNIIPHLEFLKLAFSLKFSKFYNMLLIVI